MRPASWLTRIAARPRLPRRTVRLRLTALYGVLFLLSGVGLLALTYGLFAHANDGVFVARAPDGSTAVISQSTQAPTGSQEMAQTGGKIGPGLALTPAQAAAQAERLRKQAVRQHNQEMHQFLISSGIALAGMTLVALALGWVVAGRVLNPLRTITARARRISATNLHERLALTGPDDEVKELGDTIDQLLGRLDASFAAQRHFVANASHELRTPLARQRTLIQVALDDPDAGVDALRAAHERALAANTSQEQLIDALLTLARGQAGIDRSQVVDLAEVAEEVVAARLIDARARGISLDRTLEPARVDGDRRLMERLVTNLVDNALRHNVNGGAATVATVTRDGQAQLLVTNTGPIVPADQVGQLGQPFKRLGAERTGHGQGHGLGLSIVQAIAEAHRARVSLRPQPAGGLSVTVGFLASQQPPAPTAALSVAAVQS